MFTTKNLFALIGKHILIALGALVLASGIVFFLSGQITKVSTKAMSDRRLATTLSERTALLSSLKREADIIGSNDTVIKNAFIPSNNILEFVAILKSLALKNGVTQSFNFSSPTPGTAGTPFLFATINYQNTVSSNVSTFITYIKEFEQLPYFTRIDSLNISSGSADWRTGSTIAFSASVAAQTVQ
ncbi:MAG: hypothetical protein HZB10_03230 [Candidatus Yonathbacteria bacterium]|nr:hypothetical protein [Candidatus Yonathbacteria bacterium]